MTALYQGIYMATRMGLVYKSRIRVVKGIGDECRDRSLV